MSGTVREVVAPERFVATESWGPEWPETLNTLVLTESGGRTTITLTVHYPSKAARDAALKTGMKEGMDQSFARLDTLLRTLVELTKGADILCDKYVMISEKNGVGTFVYVPKNHSLPVAQNARLMKIGRAHV